MSASKRDFTNFKKFPGKLTSNGYYTFPLLWHKDDMERWREWCIYVRLIKAPKNKITEIDWNLLKEDQIDIEKEYFNMGSIIDADTIAESWVETGIDGGKITRNAPSYYENPVNEGKSNERNVFQQALIWARSQWLKKKNSGCKEYKDDTINNKINVMYFPMLAKSFKDGEKHLEYPLYIQPKLDGVRCLVYLKEKNGGVDSVIAYTRTKKVFPSINYIKKILYPYLNELYDEENKQSIYLDGELYKHGKKLQNISGDSRNENANVSDKNKSRNEYHIYDCFYPLELDTQYKHRYEQLSELFNSFSDNALKTIKSVPTEIVSSYKEATNKYKHFISVGYEGAILRNTKGPYLANANKTGSFMRSNDLVKMKPKFTDEFKVVNYTEGIKGRDKGAVIWVCETKAGEKFNVTPKDISYKKRYEIFDDCKKNFNKKYKNKMITIEYEDLSINHVPQRAKALIFRDYE
jgi:DNA ligase-1